MFLWSTHKYNSKLAFNGELSKLLFDISMETTGLYGCLISAVWFPIQVKVTSLCWIEPQFTFLNISSIYYLCYQYAVRNTLLYWTTIHWESIVFISMVSFQMYFIIWALFRKLRVHFVIFPTCLINEYHFESDSCDKLKGMAYKLGSFGLLSLFAGYSTVFCIWRRGCWELRKCTLCRILQKVHLLRQYFIIVMVLRLSASLHFCTSALNYTWRPGTTTSKCNLEECI